MVIKTKHSLQQMSKRGIHKDLLDIVRVHGTVKKDKVSLNKNSCDRFIRKLDKHYRKVKREGNRLHIERLNTYRNALLKIRDKGGITLVLMGETLITSYNTNIKIKRKRRFKRRK
jgi:hypothetical protein